MTYKDILVHIDNLGPCKARRAAAINLAKAFDARLTGLHVRTRPYIPPYAEAQISPEILEAQAKDLERIADEAGKAFTAATKSSGVKTEWRAIEGHAPDVISLQARYFDLVVVGQGDPADLLMPGDRDMPDHAIMTSGRPAVVVPCVGQYPTIGRNVMIAWDASRTATRAVHDAMPFLKTAKSVTVMVVNPTTITRGIGDLPGADMAAHLARHGVKAEADHVQCDLEPGEMLLSRAADKGVDLLVMGAYGHARWREIVLGGVTDHILNHMTVPVLMSH
jgi:nucleotide-binding universal stress UspA family protein